MNDSCELELIGLEDKAGLSIPKFLDFFDFEIGDVFQYALHFYKEGESGANWEYKYSIRSKEVSEKSIQYGISVARRSEPLDPNYEGPPGYHSWTQVMHIDNSPDFFTNKYLNELISLDDTEVRFYPGIFQDDFMDSYESWEENSVYYSMEAKLSSNNEIIKSFHSEDNQGIYKLLEINDTQDGNPRVETMKYPGLYTRLTIELRPGLGLTYFETGDWDNQRLELVGAVTKGDTIGSIQSDEYFISSNKEIFTPQIKVYPNPFTDNLFLNLNNKSTLIIFDINGVKQFESRNEIGTIQVNLDFLNPGLYFLRIKNDEYSYNKLIVKK
jgi:hypothetical protein